MVRRHIATLPMLALAAAFLPPLDAFVWSHAALAATASGARLGQQSESVTRFVSDLSERVQFKVVTLTDPHRVVIEVPGLDWQGPPVLSHAVGVVNSVHAGDSRIVLDLRRPATLKNSFLIAPRDGLGWRLVVDLDESTTAPSQKPPAQKPPVAAPAAAKSVIAAAPPRPAPPPPRPTTAEPPPAPIETAAPVVQRSPGRIVLTSPNAAPPEAVAPAPPAPPAPPPVEERKVIAAIPPPPPAPATPAAAPAERPARGGNVLSVPMPPPPERPTPPPEPIRAEPAKAEAQRPEIQSAAMTPSTGEDAVSRPRNSGLPIIVIDPGHGGVDPGAIGVSGIYEKHITLAMARELKTALEKSGRYRVHLTRDRDVFIRLRDRVAIARQYGADLFISLHADAVQNPSIRGLSIYTLSQNASDNEAQSLAEKENKADLIAGVDLSHETADVAGILIDLAQRETMNRSAGFASEMVDEVGQEFDLLDNTHRFAGFAVLKAPDLPSVLVETGYLSNDYEEKQLRQPAYRTRLAKAIARAVDRYFPSSQKASRRQ
ncbi:N-acetylmuramoyl-L-alanine amidase [Magnetospirillum molischianum]|uniref:N-acetylmuramoyl-L-alanine amidase n=1 Tax=Magnetospirillum molischianum DSM 120 TaxID=1150626 RepID=H8FPP7_MAGML|nr:N-acetylmuramoyl-L-alanine amidase [Magnetospirillum molischianum]CCG40335.1 N-acetylmuramoyl-L-alanine amidase [Magnetospirillum molischianum DSM 120]